MQAWAAVSIAAFAQFGNSSGSTIPSRGDTPTDVPRSISAADANVDITAEDVLKALRERRPSNRIIAPASAGAGARMRDRKLLLPEGSTVVEEAGSLERRGHWWGFHPESPDSKLPELRLLANATLEGMVRTSEGADEVVRFLVSGELTEFQGENYLLPRFAARLRAPFVQPPGKDDAPDGVTESAKSSGSSARWKAPVGADAPVDDVLSVLQSRRPSEELLAVEDPEPEPESEPEPDTPSARSNRASVSTLVPDGSPLVERPGRLTRRGEDWVFVFESDHPDYPEPPMQLLPNKNVELMVASSVSGTTGLVFVVSGEVTVFNSKNHLLPRLARRPVHTANLRK